MTYTYDETIVSDLYKDTFGHRPDPIWWSVWKWCDENQKQKIWDALCEDLEHEMELQRQKEEKSLERFEKRIEANMKLGAPAREDAIRWILQSLNFDEVDLRHGAGWFCYELDLPFSMESELEPVIKQLRVA